MSNRKRIRAPKITRRDRSEVAHFLSKEVPETVYRNRNPRKERTPYYLVDLPEEAYRALESMRRRFVEEKGRDYEDLDEQFPQEGWEVFRASMVLLMKKSNHHPAQVWAFEKTRKMIHDRNFKQVPDAWTQEWQQAIKEYEKWSPGGDVPPDLDFTA